MSYFLNGVLLGLALSVLVGPIVFALLQASMTHGSRSAIIFAAGVWMSDILFALGAYFALDMVLGLIDAQWFTPVVGTFGAAILFVLGVQFYRNAAQNLPAPGGVINIPPAEIARSAWRWWRTGFFINTFNPFSFFFWITASAATFATPDPPPGSYFGFYSGVIGTIIGTDLLKVLFARYLRQRMQARFIIGLRQLSGLALVVFAVVLFWRVWA